MCTKRTTNISSGLTFHEKLTPSTVHVPITPQFEQYQPYGSGTIQMIRGRNKWE